LEQNDLLNQQRRTLESELLALKEEKRRVNAKIDNASRDLDEVNYKNGELDKITKELDYDKATLERQNAQLQASIENTTSELRTREDNLETVERQVADTQKTIANLEGDIQDLERLNERTRAEAVQQQRSVQQEVSKNLDLTAKTNTLENSLRSRELEVAELRREIDNLKNARSNQLDNKYQMEQELDVVRRDIENMSSQNEDLVNELERFSREDEKARVILDRRERVTELKLKSQSQLRQTSLNKAKYDRSPSPKRASPVKRYGKY